MSARRQAAGWRLCARGLMKSKCCCVCLCVCVCVLDKASSTCRLLIRDQSYAARRRHSLWKNGKFNYFTRRSNSRRAVKHPWFGAEDEKVRVRPFPYFTCVVAHLVHLSAHHLRRSLISKGKVSAQIMSSALFLASKRLKERQPVSTQTPSNQARGFISVRCGASLWLYREGVIAARNSSSFRPLLHSHCSNSFHFSTLASSLHPTVQGLVFICHVSGLDAHRGVSMHGCLGAQGVETQRLSQCGQTVVVSRQKPGRLREAEGELVSQEMHWKCIRVLLKCVWVCGVGLVGLVGVVGAGVFHMAERREKLCVTMHTYETQNTCQEHFCMAVVIITRSKPLFAFIFQSNYQISLGASTYVRLELPVA